MLLFKNSYAVKGGYVGTNKAGILPCSLQYPQCVGYYLLVDAQKMFVEHRGEVYLGCKTYC